MAASTESRELELVEKVDFRILAVANNVAKLQPLLNTYLPPLLLKAGSEHASVRDKVTQICQRLKTFIQAPGIVLPVAALLAQYKKSDAALVMYFDLVFVQHSLARLDVEDRRPLIPVVLRGISAVSDTSAATLPTLFNVFLRLLPDLKLPSRGSQGDAAFRKDIGLEDPKDAEFVAERLGKLLLFRLNNPPLAKLPGLTEDDIRFLTLGKPETWNPTSGLSLPLTRIKVTGFLASGAFTDEERFMPAVYAAAASDSRVSGPGDDMLKRCVVSLENIDLVNKLFRAHSKLPPPYRIRILALLTKSQVSTTLPQVLDVFEDNVNKQRATPESHGEQHAPVSQALKATSGLELTKLHWALFEYINWIGRIGPSQPGYGPIGAQLVYKLQEFINNQGFPVGEGLSRDDLSLRERAYETMGVVGRRSELKPSEFLAIIWFLLMGLLKDPAPEVVVGIDSALSSLVSVFKPGHGLDHLLGSLLEGFMLQQISGPVVRSVRHAVTKYANECLPLSDITARWIDIVAIAGYEGERSDVVEEGQKGLDPWTYHAHTDGSVALPDWRAMTHAYFGDLRPPIQPETWISNLVNEVPQPTRDVDMDARSLPQFPNFGPLSPRAFPVALDYIKRIIFLTALKDFKLETGWERRLETLVYSDLATRHAIRGYLVSTMESANDSQRLTDLIDIAFQGMVKERNTDAARQQCAQSFVDIASFSPWLNLKWHWLRAGELLFLVKSNKKEVRVIGARAFGILAGHRRNDPASVAGYTSTLVQIIDTRETAVGSELNAVEGAFLALAHMLSRHVYARTDDSYVYDTTDWSRKFPTLDKVSSSSLSTQEALFDAYSQLWTAGIGLVPGADQETTAVYISKSFIDPLFVQAKKGNEKATHALGRLAISLPPAATEPDADGNSILQTILDKLYSLYEIKQADSHFTVGEALAAAVACWDAEVVQLTVDVESGNDSYLTPKRSGHVTAVLEKLLADCKSTKPSLLKASGIWLFCFIQHCSHLPEVQARLRECQVAFMRLLSARDELVQETASRGLALVYEKGDEGLKGELVRDLVSAFTGSGPQLKVDQDTELFEAGALPTGEGKSVTSYKDIMSLANEVGDQSLVYKFMSLATNAATWSTRSAFGRFGLSSILSESEVDPKLYPKLYRYRFDPNRNVQKSMNDIWKALVKNSGAVLEEHFDAIMNDLLKSILGKEWRVREASCAAIADLISGRPFGKYEAYYAKIWAAALKVLDDVKTTVRNAALNLCISLSTTLVRQLEESGTTASAKAMMNEALPFLLSDKGIESSVEDVKLFSTMTITKIAKSGGKSLRPYIPVMVPHLLGLLSTIEPEGINYYYQRVAEDKRDQIDKLRSAIVSQSPIAEAIEDCLRSVDADVMAKLCPKLEETVKTAIGMPSKIGCSRVLTTLAIRHGADFAPYSSRFLQQMLKHILDKNDEVSKAYARATAYIIRVVPPEGTRFPPQIIKLYFGAEGEAQRQKVADAVLALSKISPDHFSALENELLPLAYVAKHDTDEYVQKEFEEVWNKHAGGVFTVHRYTAEIVELLLKALDSPQWALKHAGALATGSFAAAVSSGKTVSGASAVAVLETIWPVYDRALALKTFPDKEKLLEPFPDFVRASKPLWEKKGAALGDQLKKVALREAKRNNDEYRPHALRCLWKFAAARDDLDMLLSDIAPLVRPHMDVSEDPDAMDVDRPTKKSKLSGGGGSSSSSSSNSNLKTETAWAAIEAAARGYNRAKMAADPFAALADVVAAVDTKKPGEIGAPFIAGPEFDAIRPAFWYECAAEIFDDAAKGAAAAAAVAVAAEGQQQRREILAWFFATLDLPRADTGTEHQRLARAKAVLAVAGLGLGLGVSGGLGQVRVGEQETVADCVARVSDPSVERSADVLRVWKDCAAKLLL